MSVAVPKTGICKVAGLFLAALALLFVETWSLGHTARFGNEPHHHHTHAQGHDHAYHDDDDHHGADDGPVEDACDLSLLAVEDDDFALPPRGLEIFMFAPAAIKSAQTGEWRAGSKRSILPHVRAPPA